jgi:hypothetical protein
LEPDFKNAATLDDAGRGDLLLALVCSLTGGSFFGFSKEESEEELSDDDGRFLPRKCDVIFCDLNLEEAPLFCTTNPG